MLVGVFFGEISSNSTRQDAFHWLLIERVLLSLVGPGFLGCQNPTVQMGARQDLPSGSTRP